MANDKMETMNLSKESFSFVHEGERITDKIF